MKLKEIGKALDDGGPSEQLKRRFSIDSTTKKIHFRDDNFGNVMVHFYDSIGMTILILS